MGRGLELTKDLRELNLAQNSFCRNCFATFTDFSSLEILNLSENLNFGDQNGAHLFRGFQSDSKLKELYLRNTNITDESFAVLRPKLEKSKHITLVGMQGTNVSH